MNQSNKYVAPLLSGAILLCLTSCTAILRDRNGNQVTSFSPGSPSQLTQPAQTISQKTITIYQPDSQCQTLVPAKVTLPSTSALQGAVGKILEQRNSNNFNVTGYRVSVNPKSGIATVDMRLAPNSQRKFVSLSTCEQFALFGSLRKTLTSNPGFKIKDVRFTKQGQEISL